LETGEPSEHSLVDIGKTRKTCVEVAGRRTFRILTSSHNENFRDKVVQKIKTHTHTHTLYVQSIIPNYRSVYELMWKNMLQPDRPQMTL